VDLFYGDPDDSRPAGLYKRVPQGRCHEHLVPIVVMPKQPAHYTPRFDFHAEAQRVTEREFEGMLARAWQHALSTTR
jgi:hypothetical protein